MSDKSFGVSADIVYEIDRHDGEDDNASPLERVQLLCTNDMLLLRNAGGKETPCAGADIAAVLSTTPSLREIRPGETVRISCAPEVVSQLPFVLQPVRDGEDSSGNYATVNGTSWTAYPAVDEDYVMLPGRDEDEEPDISPCWAEHGVEEGEWNPLAGHTTIGLAVPGFAVEYGRYDHGGTDPRSAVSARPFDDFATVFVDWLVRGSVPESLWGGDSAPHSPTVQLFADAAEAKNRQGYWSTEMDDEDEDEDETGDKGDAADDGDEDCSHRRRRISNFISPTTLSARSVPASVHLIPHTPTSWNWTENSIMDEHHRAGFLNHARLSRAEWQSR